VRALAPLWILCSICCGKENPKRRERTHSKLSGLLIEGSSREFPGRVLYAS